MKILIVTKHIGETAPGLVFEKLILELSKFNKIDIITCSNNILDDCIALSVNKVLKIDYPNIINDRIDTHLDQISFRVFSVALRDWITARKDILLYDKYDWIISFCSMYHLLPLLIGSKIKKKYGYNHTCYFVDAIPTPKWWAKTYYGKGYTRFVRKYTKYVDRFYSSNELMLSYQKQFLHKKCKKIGVIYTPNDGMLKEFRNLSSNKNVFLYTGSLYGLRTPKYIFEALRKLLKKYPNSYIYFVGTGDTIKKHCPIEIQDNIKIIPYSKDLTSLYEISTALIDIDADYENDIFLSSKITNYLLINRPIICETGENSPAKKLFSNKKSIICCNHDSEELYDAMCNTIEKIFDYTDRNESLSLFSVQSVVARLLNDLTSEF